MFLFLCTKLFQKWGHYSRGDINQGNTYGSYKIILYIVDKPCAPDNWDNTVELKILSLRTQLSQYSSEWLYKCECSVGFNQK